MRITDAADLLTRAYDQGRGLNLAYTPLNRNGVEAYLTTDGTLVIPGTNDRKDWWRNLNIGSAQAGASRRVWHSGFLEHARSVFHYGATKQPKRVVGHSLGAAAAQIVAVSLNIPAICFASPRPLRGARNFGGEQKVLNINRRDDFITNLPPFFLFRHVGRVHWVSPNELQSAGSHTIKDYLRGMSQGTVRPPLPDNWG